MATWPNNLQQKAANYVDAIGNFFAHDPDGQLAFGSYDAFNEPDCCPGFPSQFKIIAMTYKRLGRIHAAPGTPRLEFTVGFADYTMTRKYHKMLHAHRVKQTYLSYHCYESQPSFTTVAQNHAALGQRLNLPVVCSEFYDIRFHAGTFAGQAAVLKSSGVGGQMWGIFHSRIRFGRVPPSSILLSRSGREAFSPHLLQHTPIGLFQQHAHSPQHFRMAETISPRDYHPCPS